MVSTSSSPSQGIYFGFHISKTNSSGNPIFLPSVLAFVDPERAAERTSSFSGTAALAGAGVPWDTPLGSRIPDLRKQFTPAYQQSWRGVRHFHNPWTLTPTTLAVPELRFRREQLVSRLLEFPNT